MDAIRFIKNGEFDIREMLIAFHDGISAEEAHSIWELWRTNFKTGTLLNCFSSEDIDKIMSAMAACKNEYKEFFNIAFEMDLRGISTDVYLPYLILNSVRGGYEKLLSDAYECEHDLIEELIPNFKDVVGI